MSVIEIGKTVQVSPSREGALICTDWWQDAAARNVFVPTLFKHGVFTINIQSADEVERLKGNITERSTAQWTTDWFEDWTLITAEKVSENPYLHWELEGFESEDESDFLNDFANDNSGYPYHEKFLSERGFIKQEEVWQCEGGLSVHIGL